MKWAKIAARRAMSTASRTATPQQHFNIPQGGGIRKLLPPTHVILSEGCDDRTVIDPNVAVPLNKYFASTVPRPEVVRRGSCTCSTIDDGLFSVANDMKVQLEESLNRGTAIESNIMNEVNAGLRERLKSVLQLRPEEQTVLFPSGTDAEFLPMMAALVRSESLRQKLGTTETLPSGTKMTYHTHSGPKLFNFIVAAGEIGSGSSVAADGKHFSPVRPIAADGDYPTGSLLTGLPKGTVEMVPYIARNDDGSIDFKESALVDDVRQRLNDPANGPHSVALLHLVLGAKSGFVYPSVNTIETLREEFGDRVMVVVDACQLRSRMECIREFTDMGYMSLVTGSKFFCGPPFSGAAVLPSGISDELETHLQKHTTENGFVCPLNDIPAVPVGIRSYLTPYEVPDEMPQLKAFVVEAHKALHNGDNGSFSTLGGVSVGFPPSNMGLMLRWHSALSNMEAYADVYSKYGPGSQDVLLEAFVSRWRRGVGELLKKYAPAVMPFDVQEGLQDSGAMLGDVNTIVSFTIRVKEDENDDSDSAPRRCLSLEESKAFYHMMTLPVTIHPRKENIAGQDFGKYHFSTHHSEILQTPMMLGQPVKLSPTTTILRIALGADMVIKAFNDPTFSARPSMDRVERLVEDMLVTDAKVVAKIALMAEHWNDLYTRP
jgi:hypothetical protein